MEGYYSSKKLINKVACTTKMKAAASPETFTLENLPDVTAQNIKASKYTAMRTADFK
jgi:hypothetical protein